MFTRSAETMKSNTTYLNYTAFSIDPNVVDPSRNVKIFTNKLFLHVRWTHETLNTCTVSALKTFLAT
jgi:hypothetical protein